jgi:hypothetical protein
MKKSTFSEDQCAGRRASAKRRFTVELRSLRQLEEENRKPKQLVTGLSLDKAMLQAIVVKKCMVRPAIARFLDIRFEVGGDSQRARRQRPRVDSVRD